MDLRPETVPNPEAVARTYKVNGRVDPFEAVQEYRQVRQAMNKHPEKRSQAIATVTGLPRERIRTWVDEGGKPDPVRGIQIATDRGWFIAPQELNGERGRALSGLVSWIISGGSILADHCVPSFIVDREGSLHVLEELCDILDVELTHLERKEKRDEHHSGNEYRVRDDGSVLGRVLTAAGAPRGKQRVPVPGWIQGGPRAVCEAFVEIYLLNRAVSTKTGEENSVRWRAHDRPKWIVENHANFISAVLGGTATTVESSGGYNVTIKVGEGDGGSSILQRIDAIIE